MACHGGRAEGTLIGPQIVGRSDGPFTYERILHQVRTPLLLMPDYPEDVLSDEKVKAITDSWTSLEPPR